MIDFEVERLRRLRASALRLRAVSRALGANRAMLDDGLLSLGACAAWRVARVVSGHLRAHPYESFQKDAGLGTLLMNGLVAKAAALGTSRRSQVLAHLERHSTALSRELDDARALTRAADLSDSFGRSQNEIRSLIAAVECAAGAAEATALPRPVPQPRAVPPLPRRTEMPRRPAPVSGSSAAATAAGGDWPYLAF